MFVFVPFYAAEEGPVWIESYTPLLRLYTSYMDLCIGTETWKSQSSSEPSSVEFFHQNVND